MVRYVPPALGSIENAVLRTKEGVELVAKQLWQEQPVVVLSLRRPGCILCRDQASKVWKESEPALREAGVKLVCVVHEWIPREINGFSPAFWPGELYHDVDKAFYKVYGEGKVRRGGLGQFFSLAMWRRVFAAQSRVKEHNLQGDGYILGGMLVIKKGDGGIAYMHPEKNFGEYGPLGEATDVALALAKE